MIGLMTAASKAATTLRIAMSVARTQSWRESCRKTQSQRATA